jgi:acetyltransferase-like isoleucine patch superfamily enzyme
MSLGWNEDIKKSLAYCGEQVFIGHNVMFAYPELVWLGDRTRIDPFTLVTTRLKTAENVQICAHSMIGGGRSSLVVLGKWTFIGYGSKLFCASEDYSGEYGPVNEFWGHNRIYRGDIVFADYSGVASDVMVFPGVVLPEGCLIGAKSLVHTSAALTAWSIWKGIPAEFWRDRNKDSVLKHADDSTWIKTHE